MVTFRSLAGCLRLTLKRNPRAPRVAGWWACSLSTRRGPRPSLLAPSGVPAAAAALSPVAATTEGWRRGRQRRDGARARAGRGRGARPFGAAAGEERPPALPPAARAPNGPGWGCEVTVAARGSWEATPSLQSREVPERKEAPAAPLHRQHVADPAAPPLARRGPRAAAAGAALTRHGAGGRPERGGRERGSLNGR